MARTRCLFKANFPEQWERSYPRLQAAEQKGIEKVVMALVKGETTPGMRIRPIEPEKYFNEARRTDQEVDSAYPSHP